MAVGTPDVFDDDAPEPDPLAEPELDWREAFWLGLSGEVEPDHIIMPIM